jgi:cyclopropane fatty-acyl-phospholipid synthase-like methyltransferase
LDPARALARYRTGGGAASYAGKYERSWTRRLTARREEAILASMLSRFGREASLLNVPCGAGRFARLVAPEARRRTVFADVSRPMIDAAGAALAAAGVTRVELRLEDVTRTAPPERFDVVLCVRLLHHLDAAAFDAALDYLAAAATAGIVCTFASTATWKGFWRERRRAAGRKRGGEILRSPERVREALDARGWRVAEVRPLTRLFSTQTWLLAVPAGR